MSDRGLDDDPAAHHLPLGDPGLLHSRSELQKRVGLVGLTDLDTPRRWARAWFNAFYSFKKSRRLRRCEARKRLLSITLDQADGEAAIAVLLISVSASRVSFSSVAFLLQGLSKQRRTSLSPQSCAMVFNQP